LSFKINISGTSLEDVTKRDTGEPL